MASLSEFARSYTNLDHRSVAHLQRLVASWGILADLCFADLLLHAPVDGNIDRIVALGHVRPITSQTIYGTDWMGSEAPVGGRPVVTRALRTGEIVEGEVTHPVGEEQVQIFAVPVRMDGEVIAVLTRESVRSMERPRGDLEETYLEVFLRFAKMLTAGSFPFPDELRNSETVPRVGDGVLVLDAGRRIRFSSPNALSALHRLGLHERALGSTLVELGLDNEAVDQCLTLRIPVAKEIKHGSETTLAMRCVPILEGAIDSETTGVLVLLRDVTELRVRDQMLRSKDASIREIHHRVKNNLQTISSLLRLQGRRLESAEAKAAIEESVRRIQTIALVHETLSRDTSDDISFVEIIRPLLRMVEDGLVAPDRRVSFEVTGDLGRLPTAMATPMAVVLTELLQNAVQHAFRDMASADAGLVRVELGVGDGRLEVSVVDDGIGVPEDFVHERSGGLGLSIVRTLVTDEMGGSLSIRPGLGPPSRAGTRVDISVPADARRTS